MRPVEAASHDGPFRDGVTEPVSAQTDTVAGKESKAQPAEVREPVTDDVAVPLPRGP